MIHYYKSRRNQRVGSKDPLIYRQLCTNSWEQDVHDAWSSTPTKFTTALKRVTCTECLKILIPKRESELSKMKSNLLLGVKEEGPSVAQMPEANMGAQSTST